METGVMTITIRRADDAMKCRRFETFDSIDEMVVYELSKEIIVAKKKLLETIKAHTEDVIAKVPDIPGLTKMEQRKRSYIRRTNNSLYKDYVNLLEGFIIVNAKKVHYNGETFTQDEPVRRLTKNHLAFLEERQSDLREISGASQAYREYKSLIEQFLPYVKYVI